jgi:hypothetical protein
MTTETRKRRGQWRGWPQQMIREHGQPALVGMCGGMRVLMVPKGSPAKVLVQLAAQHEEMQIELDEGGVRVVTPDLSGWPSAGSYLDAFEVRCRIHDGHVIDADRLLDEWFCVNQQKSSGRAVQLADLEPQPRANV